jgi:hypothetical protein
VGLGPGVGEEVAEVSIGLAGGARGEVLSVKMRTLLFGKSPA